LLSFFGDHDAIGGCGWVDPSQSAIYHWTELDRLAFADPPLELEARAEQGVVLRPCLDLSDSRWEAAETMPLTAEKRPRYASLYLDAHGHGIPAEVRPYCVHNKLLGWPRLVQDDLSLGMETGDRPIRLLLQLDGDFGPGGSVYFLMNGVGLAARRFGHNQFAVQVT
jgi:Domain of unknown function (DUF1963)